MEPVKKLLVNAIDPEEYRVALVEDGRLEEFYIETTAREQIRANIYKGVVAHVEPAFQAAFVDYGGEKHGFLQADEIHPDYFQQTAESPGADGKVPALPIQKMVGRGQEILVQVTKEETGKKGVALTTYLSLAGNFLVLTPGDPQIGISRKIEGEEERTRLKDIISQLKIPEGIGCIVRTVGEGKSKRELAKNLDNLLRLWEEIRNRAIEQPAPSLIYKEIDLAIRSVRDHFSPDIQEVLIDNKDIYKQVLDFLRIINPQYGNRVKLYKETRPIFSKYQIENQIETIFQNRVNLKSGGQIVIDPTEALVAVDVNSGRSVKERQIEETAFKTNGEAAEEIARQLRLRDLGGLIVIDFIDMKESKHRNEIQRVLKNHLKKDRARTTLGRISKFGILELSRQRIRPPIQFGTYYTCPTCQGKGQVRSVETLALSYLRKIWLGISKGTVTSVRGILPVEVAHYLLNRKREDLLRLETRHGVTIHLEGQSHILPEQGQLEFKKKETSEPLSSPGETRDPGPEEGASLSADTDRNEGPPAEAASPGDAHPEPPPRPTKPGRRKRPPRHDH